MSFQKFRLTRFTEVQDIILEEVFAKQIAAKHCLRQEYSGPSLKRSKKAGEL